MRRAVFSILLLLPTALPAQDFSLDATFGNESLTGGFTPDPYTVPMTAGGSIDASDVGCVGNIANAPDFELTFEPGSLSLYIAFASEGDTTLAINTPDGSWQCDDDGGDGLNPLIEFSSPQSGVYDIWVGTYGTDYQDGVLYITELSGNTTNLETSLSSSGGGSSSGSGSSSSSGSSAPLSNSLSEQLSSNDATGIDGKYQDTYEFQGSSGQDVSISLQSAAFDTYLILLSPSGNRTTNDDFNGSLDESRLDTTLSESGTYQIIATSFSTGETGSYTLDTSMAVSEGSGRAGAFNGDLTANDDTRLSGQYIDTFQFDGEAGTSIDVFLSSSEFQTYLILEAPSGRIIEDFDRESISQSTLQTELSESGVYNIYVSSYEQGETGTYLLRINGVDFTEI